MAQEEAVDLTVAGPQNVLWRATRRRCRMDAWKNPAKTLASDLTEGLLMDANHSDCPALLPFRQTLQVCRRAEAPAWAQLLRCQFGISRLRRLPGVQNKDFAREVKNLVHSWP